MMSTALGASSPEVLGGKVVLSGDVTYVAPALDHHQCWRGPTDDKTEVTFETPRDPDRVSSFLNIWVADIRAVYVEWSDRGATEFCRQVQVGQTCSTGTSSTSRARGP